MSITLRGAQATDVDWIAALLNEGARDGYFAPSFAQHSRSVVTSTLEHGRFPMMKAGGAASTPAIMTSSLLVAEYGGVPASFVLVLDHGDEVEIYLAATSKAHRRRGCFTALINDQIAKHAGRVMLARCFEKSSWAMSAFMKAGFTVRRHGKPVELALNSQLTDPAPAPASSRASNKA